MEERKEKKEKNEREEISSSGQKRKKKMREIRRKEERKARKKTDGFFLQQSEFVGPRSKVHLRNEGYAPRGRDSSYFGLFSTLRVVWLCFFPKGLFGQILELGNVVHF